MRYLLVILLPVSVVLGQQKWMLGPFVKVDSMNPCLQPRREAEFTCPIRHTPVHWEEKDVFNPAAVVRDAKVYLLYRAQDRIGKPAGTSRIGLAWSDDGFRFSRAPGPVLYPSDDSMRSLEWEGGCEDPRVVEDDSGRYVMTYTAFDSRVARLCIATSADLVHWTKHGPAFGGKAHYRNTDGWSKSGAIVCRRIGNRLVAVRIRECYWMYWGESSIFLATSRDLIHWTPLVTDDATCIPVFSPRPHKFDSGLVEPGPPAILTGDGIVLIYNGRNDEASGDPKLIPGMYAAGQALLDSVDPGRLIDRSENCFLKPDHSFEREGQVRNVCFVEGLAPFNDRWLLYYGTADSRVAVAASPKTSSGGSLVNFAHLERLTERISFLGDSVDIVHVYANSPDYTWAAAAEAGPEGIACVDDAARAAVLYCRHFELTRYPGSLARAKRLLLFVMKMEAPDGLFYNFIHQDHSINESGRTSLKSFGWWAVRGIWALASGARVFRDVEPAFASLLQEHVAATLVHVRSLLEHYGQFRTISGFRTPRWLVNESAADATSELLLGLTEYSRIVHDPEVVQMVEKLSEGIMIMQAGNARTFPYGLHRSWETLWHMWGNGQTQALATAGKALDESRMIGSAMHEASFFYSRLLIEGFVKEIDVSRPGEQKQYEQIAYGVRPMAVGLVRLYEATGDSVYLAMAGLAGSWFFGNNGPYAQMYDPATGRGYDGIQDSVRVNKNAGAESTIEALMTLLEIERFPYAARFLRYRLTSRTADADRLSGYFRDDSGNQAVLELDMQQQSVSLHVGR